MWEPRILAFRGDWKPGDTVDTPCDEYHSTFLVGRDGRPAVYNGGRRMYAHRLVVMQEIGHLEPWQVVIHKCDNTLCLRLDHLVVGTQQENIADMIAKGRAVFPVTPPMTEERRNRLGDLNKAKTHCPHGHPYSAENTLIDPQSGARRCATCRAGKNRRAKIAATGPRKEPRHAATARSPRSTP